MDCICAACQPIGSSSGTIPSLLDVGCGDGALINFLSNVPTVDYLGVDVSTEMIEPGRKQHPKKEFIAGSFPDSLSGDNRKFDTVLFNGSLQFFMDTRATLVAASSPLKEQSGSRIVLSHVNGAKFVKDECRNSMGVAVRSMPSASSLETYGGLLGMKVVSKEELLEGRDFDKEKDGNDDDFYLVALEKV